MLFIPIELQFITIDQGAGGKSVISFALEIDHLQTETVR